MTLVARLDSEAAGFSAALDALTRWDVRVDDEIERAAAAIVADVRARGDAAVLEHTARFDALDVQTVAALEIGSEELATHLAALAPAERDAMESAAERIRRYHAAQRANDFEIDDAFGNRLASRTTPLERVGVYVPGGRAAYPSTVLMTVIPARVAGVDEIIVTVPTPRGERCPLVLAALALAGVDRVFSVGGAQAIAALAFGTATIPRVDKIVGPGGRHVAAAKRLVFGPVGIDSIAGPSEILVVADGTAPPRWIALDLFSQAEHDDAAQAILLCPDAAYLDRVEAEMTALVDSLGRRDIVRRSLAARGALIRVRDLDDAISIANRIAPEHVELAVADPERWLPRIRHAGAIFLGALSSETLGDYVAGPSHVLPTFGTARFASPLGVHDFQKRSSVIAISAKGADSLGRIAAVIARGEGLDAHARAAEARIGAPKDAPVAQSGDDGARG